MIDAVVFDVGETLVDETREYGSWADWLGVPRHTFSAVFGAVIMSGRDYRETFGYFRSDFDLATERKRREMAGKPEQFWEEDLYPDVREGMKTLREMCIWVGIAGNQTARAGVILRELNLPADMIATSEDWGASKPDVRFFQKLVSVTPCQPQHILYVGDRFDNDLAPAKSLGIQTASIHRGPWGYIWEDHPETQRSADWRISSIADLAEIVATVNRPGH
jgi:HAD superfamily hydrolase (TIGR01549 family)